MVVVSAAESGARARDARLVWRQAAGRQALPSRERWRERWTHPLRLTHMHARRITDAIVAAVQSMPVHSQIIGGDGSLVRRRFQEIGEGSRVCCVEPHAESA